MWQSLSGIARAWFGRSKSIRQRQKAWRHPALFEAVEPRQLLTTLSIVSEPLAENAAGGFWLSRSGNVSAPLDVRVQLSSATATAGSDFTAFDRTIQFAAEQTQIWVEVQHLDDNVAETTEGYAIAVSASDGASTSGQGWILDNDSSGSGSGSGSSSGSLWVTGGSFAENSPAGFWVGRNGDTSAPLDIAVAVSSGTATTGSDFVALNRTVHLNAGETQAWVEVEYIDDTIAESSERYGISALASDGRTALGQGWILDNDGSGSGSGFGSSSGSTSGTAPVIQNFDCMLDDNTLIVTGVVIDNADPTGYWVRFGDLLQGWSVQVMEDDTFKLVITDWTEHGDISAWVTDSTLLTSQTVWDVV
jgi:hypothetical protein